MKTQVRWTRGDRLAKALRIANIGNAQMAARLGVTRNTVGNYIADRTPIKEAALRVWADETGLPLEWLKNGEETEPGMRDYSATVSTAAQRPRRSRPTNRVGNTGPKGRAR